MKTIEILGFVFELLFLIMGVAIYLFCKGYFTPSEPLAKLRAENFRKENSRWLSIVALLLIAMMLVELGLHAIQGL